MNSASNMLRHGRWLFGALGAVILLLVPVLICSAAEQSVGGVEVEGYASIVAGRKDQAREAALQNAFRRAVEQVVGVAVESRTVVKDSELLNDRIFSKSRGLIKTYRVVGERVESDAYRVTVLATVSRYRLEQELDNVGLLMRKLGKPRIAIVVTEHNVEGPTAPGGIVETSLVAAFGRKGYALVDRQAMLAAGELAAKGQQDHTDAVVRAAVAGGAEVVIVGHAAARSGGALSGTSLRPVQASVTGRAIEADTGELLATVVTTQQALHVNAAAAGSEALQKAAVELTEQLNRQMIKAWNKRLTGLRTLRMTVVGIPQQDVGRLRDAVKEQLGQVEEVYERGYREEQLRLDLEVTGSTRTLIDELPTLRLDGAQLTIAGFSGGQLQVRWKRQALQGGHKP